MSQCHCVFHCKYNVCAYKDQTRTGWLHLIGWGGVNGTCKKNIKIRDSLSSSFLKDWDNLLKIREHSLKLRPAVIWNSLRKTLFMT